jgi:hypothetical protein
MGFQAHVSGSRMTGTSRQPNRSERSDLFFPRTEEKT